MYNSPIDEIKSRIDIIEVIGSYIKLRKAGANYKAVCPFHSEKTPSFFVSPARQMWHCFGCGAGHSVFDFIMKIEGVEFGDALRILAKRTGVELKPIKPEIKTKRQRFYEICDLAARFFEKQLGSSKYGKVAKDYLLKRGINEQSIEKWRLGWAPHTWHGLSNFLTSHGYKMEEVVSAGLAVRNEQGRCFDRFRKRIMFPVFDINSQIIGFGGRVLKKTEKEAKYVNTPNTVLYDKGRILYGLDKSKVEIRRKDFCILAEGYVDVIMAHQSGFENMVATSGTALSSYQLDILKRYSDNVFLAFDMDFAGDAATKRGIDLAQMKGFNIKVIKFTEGKDPADVISESPDKFKELVSGSLSILDFYFQNAFSQFDADTPEGKRKISGILLPVIKKIPNRIEQSFWIQKLAAKLKVKEVNIEEELKKVSYNKGEDEEVSILESENPVFQKTRKELLEERLMSLILKQPEHSDLVDKDVSSILSPKAQEVLQNYISNKTSLSKDGNDFVAYLSLKADFEKIDERDILPEIKFCLKEIKLMESKNKMDKISLEIKRAEEENDDKKVEELSSEFNKLTKKITSS